MYALTSAHTVSAQTAEPKPSEKAPIETGEITVTATRVVRDGYKAPTPTSVIGAVEIANKAPANIADLVNQIPSMFGSATPLNAVAGVSGGQSGINTLNLRNLGPNRTLVLLDGQRIAASTLTGWVDVNNLPQALVKRVDVVTGGASAGWGSDAVAGVVNFVLDKDFTGLKGEVSGGLTTYGDNGDYKVSLTWGSGFAGGRGHILLSAEDAHSNGITGVPRSWARTAKLLGTNPAYAAGNGQPQFLTTFTGFATATPGGIITSGPAKGTYFGAGGIPLRYNYGTVSGNFMQGGQNDAYDFASQAGDLAPRLDRKNIFFRTSFDLSDHVQIFGQASYGQAHSDENALAFAGFNFFTINPVTNAFLPASVAAAAGTTPFTLGSYNQDYGSVIALTRRSTRRFVAGLNGDFNALGSNWSWDAYGQTTTNDIYVESYQFNLANLKAAVDAVRNPTTGAIQCASVATNPNCVPYNVFGIGVNSPAALAYVAGRPWGRTKLTQDVFAANLHGTPFSDWAGPISMAAGIEHRREAVSGSNDPLSNTNGWRSGNQHATSGSYQVTEGYLELVVPLLKDQFLGKSMDLNGAVRQTDYSLSGAVTTWKAGLTYSPIDDITFRITRSRDIRAPNLSDLFAVGATATSGGLFDTVTGTNAGPRVLTVTSGTTNLKPEVANSLNLGVVVRPRFLPGFEASVDYYRIDINNSIFTTSTQQIIDQCAQGSSQACAAIIRDGSGAITQVNVVPINLAKQLNRGIDFEASYRRHLSVAPFIDGTLTIRGLATHFLQNLINNGITTPTDNVGTNSDGVGGVVMQSLPRWKYQASINWDQGPLSLGFTLRGVSDGVLNTSYISCASACPTATPAHPTIDDNHIPGAIYFDSNFKYTVSKRLEVFAVVQNLLNTDPVATAYGPSVGSNPLAISPNLYDVLGRTFRFGVRFKM
ncbi:TonB-dependent receptor [Sphingomonas oligophenolica]|uniref:TonB-dependent receptor n=1 Tax=Sphingomonas oligophenolica TaxID=301154 RepID=A0ABU9YAK7_9SPHN